MTSALATLSVYLAGPINASSDAEVHDWRDDMTRRLRTYDVINPADRDYRGIEDINHVELVEADLEDIDRSDFVIAHCPKPSVGTSMEVMYAAMKDIPVIAFVPPGTSVSPWLRYHSVGVYNYAFEVHSALLRESLRA